MSAFQTSTTKWLLPFGDPQVGDLENGGRCVKSTLHFSDTCHNFKDLKWSCLMLRWIELKYLVLESISTCFLVFELSQIV